MNASFSGPLAILAQVLDSVRPVRDIISLTSVAVKGVLTSTNAILLSIDNLLAKVRSNIALTRSLVFSLYSTLSLLSILIAYYKAAFR